MNESGQEPSFREKLQALDNWASLIARSFALPMELILRRGFGRDYFGLQAGIATLALLFWPLLMPEANPLPMFVFFCLFLFLNGLHNVSGMIRRARGYVCHSRYSGRPWLMGVFRGWNEVTVKRQVEPFVGVIAGILLMGLSPQLGLLLIVSGMALGHVVICDVEYDRRRAQDMYDAYLDQQATVEMFRKMRGEAGGVSRGDVIDSAPASQQRRKP